MVGLLLGMMMEKFPVFGEHRSLYGCMVIGGPGGASFRPHRVFNLRRTTK